MSHPFQTGGALLADSPVYVEREADTEALAHLRSMAYLLFIEPRQQGKTSFINRLMPHSALSSDTLALIDLTTLDASSETGWYRSLCTRLLRQLRFIPRTDRPAPAENSTGWRDFLINVSEQADAAHRRTIVALDEIGAVVIPWAEPFFCVLREVFNARQAEPYFRHLTFILSGAFHPRDLIEDDRISPFNVAQRVRLADFTLAQVRELVGKGNWTDEQAAALAERIHYWTDGQPYLIQLLCSYLGPDAAPADVDAGVERLRREDENHLPPMLKRLNRDERLRRYVERILAGECIKFYPRENRRQAQLELLGVIKGGTEGFCIVRNRTYERVLAGVAGPAVGSSMPTATPHPELNDALTRRTLVLFIGADLPREVTGLPSRADLARELARRKGLDESLSLAEVAQRVSQAGNRWEFTDFIRSALDTTGKSPQPFHRCIVELVKTHRIETFITTAYDNLLELAFQEAGVGINRVVRGSDVSFINPDRPTLIKLYGDAQQPDTLVVTDRDHSNLLRDREREALVDEVQRAFRRNTVLFLGYNLADPDFRFLFDQIAESRFARTAYAVWPGLPEADVRMWRDRGIVILDTDPMGILSEAALQPVSCRRPETTIPVSASPSPTGGEEMNYERGLQTLESFVKPDDEEAWRDFTLYKGQLLENLSKERRYGTTETLRNERFQILDKLNPMALRLTGLSFTDMCLGKRPSAKQRPTSDDHEVVERLKRIEAKFDQGRTEDRQAATQILDAIDHNQIERTEVAQMVTELRTWAQTVQQVGLPLNPELRAALDALAEHTGGVYQYLELALPIIPGILSYKVELGSQHQVDLKALWERIKTRLGKGFKGNGVTTGPQPLYGTGQHWAVLVGVNEYEDKANYGQLHVCVKDVHAIREQLIAGGFDPARIRLLTDQTGELPTKANILVALKAVADATEPDDLLLFYYSGHGDQDGGESYLVACNGRRLVLSDTAVRVSRVKEIIEQAPACAKVIVLDACHSGADIGGKGPKPMSEAFIRRVFEQAEGMAVLASCKQGQLSYEWRENERSVFTHFLLEALEGRADRDEKGFVTVQDANRHVANSVKLWASQRNLSQTPTLQYTVAGDIILVRHQ